MATIKDVARLCGVSVTTVSIIANGKARERKISSETQERVLAAMQQLGYQPNLAARRLRAQESARPLIAFFWPPDYRTMILASFLNALQVAINKLNFDCELVIQTYENDHLKDYDASILRTGYNAIIIGACSQRDMEYLKSLSPQIPLVLLNRYSEQFSTIGVDNQMVGMTAARQIRQRGYTETAVFSSVNPYVATSRRLRAFLDACSQIGISIPEEYILHGPENIGGAEEFVQQYLQLQDPPHVIFCDMDSVAVGALRAFHNHGVRIPQDVEILAISMLEREITENSIPSLSVLEMPNMEIGYEIIALIKEKITRNSLEPSHITVDTKLILRESFPAQLV